MSQAKRKYWWLGLELIALLSAACGDESVVGTDEPLEEEQDSDGYGDEDGRQSRGQRNQHGRPELGSQIDRMGRAAISTALVASFDPNEASKGAAKDAYNAETQHWTSFEPELAKNLAIVDALDTVCGNQLLAGEGKDRYAPLASILADDQLVLNTDSGECGVYLGVEAEAVGALEPGAGGCGGRTPLDDVIERSYSLLAAGTLDGIDDTIVEDDQVHDLNQFPWLAEPQN